MKYIPEYKWVKLLIEWPWNMISMHKTAVYALSAYYLSFSGTFYLFCFDIGRTALSHDQQQPKRNFV